MLELCGVIVLTYTAEFTLRIIRLLFVPKLIQHLPEPDQVEGAERRAPVSNLPKLIRRIKVRQIRSD